tara:strand:+ start:3126 stop:4424 length:1299 start_codon:yes stop_codon:yes gene_type:complete
MKDSLHFTINIFGVISIWVFTAFFSSVLSQIFIFSTFIFFALKGLKFHLFFVYILFLILSDSRLEILSFIPSVKPLVSLMFYFITFLIIKKSKFSSSLISVKFLLPFVILVFLSYIINDFNTLVLQKSISYILLFLLIPLLIDNLILENRNKFIKSTAYIFASVLVLGFISIYFLDDFSLLKGRYRGVFGNPNGLGIFCLLFFFIVELSFNKHNNYLNHYEKYFFIFLIFVSLLLTQSRSCLLAILIYYVFNFLISYSSVLAISFLLFTFIIFGYMSFNLKYLVSFLSLENYIRIESIEDASGRYVAWDFLKSKFTIQNVFFGNGIGRTEILFKNNYSYLSMLGHEGNAHNSFLTLLYDIGFFGLISLFFYVIKSFLNSVNFIKYIPIIFGVSISAFFESWLSASLNPFTILFVFIIVLVQLDNQKLDHVNN